MAETGKPEPGRRGRYYAVPTAIKEVAGVTVSRGEDSDEYGGTAEALSEAGLLPLHLFPGQPGMPTSSVVFRPLGVAKAEDECWHRVPGYMRVYRTMGGDCRVILNVDAEERARREAARARKKAAQAAHQPKQDASTAAPRADEAQSIFILGSTFFSACEASPAKFKVGDEAISWEAEEVVEVVGGYGCYEVQEDGYRLGYVVRDADGHKYFAPAHRLLETKTNRVRHLRLVETRAQA